jgi:hypothetical protein
MELAQQVCTLEQAKKLKELGVKAETYFKWGEAAEHDRHGSVIVKWHPTLFVEVHGEEKSVWCSTDEDDLLNDDNEFNEVRGLWPAFTTAELGVMLPEYRPSNSNIATADFVERKSDDGFVVGYDMDSSTMGGYGPDVKDYFDKKFISSSEAEARAHMLIYLLEGGFVNVGEVNQRLNPSLTPLPISDKN